MRRLHLLRHAKSDWDDPALADHERPLAKRGRKAAKRIGEHMARSGIAPGVALCSTATRARETLERVEPALAEGARIELDPGLYGSGAQELLDAVRRLPDEVDEAILVGHNPAIRELALRLAQPGPDRDRIDRKLPTAALATLSFEADWAALSEAGAELTGYVVPKGLG